MYSEKVMQHFKNPHNMGEIKDADGIGKIGNPTCLLPDEKIHKNSECLSISKIKKGQKILSHTGQYEQIAGKYSRNHTGWIIRFKNRLGQVSLTPEHLVYSIIIPNGDKFRRNKGKRELYPAWHHAEDLKKGDIVLYPKLKKEEDVEFLDILIPKKKWDYRSPNIPCKIPLSSDLLRLFGYFLSEGNIQNKPSKNYISFTLNIREEEIVNDIGKICNKLFNLKIKVVNYPKHKTVRVFIYNAKISRWFYELFGNGANRKRLPDFLMNLPAEKQKSIIFGLWKGDGYVNLNRKGARAGFTTISYQLAQQVKIILLRLDIVPSIYTDKSKKVKGILHQEAYRIHVGQKESLRKLCAILGLKFKPKSHSSIGSWYDKDYLYTLITSKKIFNYTGNVNNLEVKNTHSFVSDAFCLHNCGDIMWVYIKVGKNAKGEEILTDIKVKTFGCVAAIATSSMTTDLAMGKTLEEAKKLTRDNVKDALQGLPAVKVHCSNLAADALHLAIKDYEEKKAKRMSVNTQNTKI